jgi:hypothetical protein
MRLAVRTALLLACMVTRSSAQPADPEEWLRQGVALRKEGKDEAAYALFQRAVAASPTPRAYAHLGAAEQALGRWVDADEHLRAALAATDDPWIVRYRIALEEAARYVGGHIGLLEVAGTSGTELTVNGRLAGRLPLAQPLRLPAGPVAIEARLPGLATVVRVTNLPPGGTARELFEIQRPVAAAPLPPPTPAPRPLGRSRGRERASDGDARRRLRSRAPAWRRSSSAAPRWGRAPPGRPHSTRANSPPTNTMDHWWRTRLPQRSC